MHATMANCEGQLPTRHASDAAAVRHAWQQGDCPPSLVHRSVSTAEAPVCVTRANAGDGSNDKLNVERMLRCALAKTPAVDPPLLLIPRRVVACPTEHEPSDMTGWQFSARATIWLGADQPQITL